MPRLRLTASSLISIQKKQRLISTVMAFTLRFAGYQTGLSAELRAVSQRNRRPFFSCELLRRLARACACSRKNPSSPAGVTTHSSSSSSSGLANPCQRFFRIKSVAPRSKRSATSSSVYVRCLRAHKTLLPSRSADASVCPFRASPASPHRQSARCRRDAYLAAVAEVNQPFFRQALILRLAL